jgi:activator of 2-hydroxyglutaryl-CoA dehydratase
MYCVGIDIGSTAAKVIVISEDNREIVHHLLMPTGWSGKETASNIQNWLKERNITSDNSHITAIGYGRVSVPYAHKVITEITCHGKGAY